MRVHFICRGNAFRSRMAEAYLKSLRIDGLEVISSGTVAEVTAAENGLLCKYAEPVLKDNGILEFAKPKWDQLTPEMINPSDITVCVNQRSFAEAQQIAEMPKDTIIWEVNDFDDYELEIGKKLTEKEKYEYAKKAYSQIKALIDNLVASL